MYCCDTLSDSPMWGSRWVGGSQCSVGLLPCPPVVGTCLVVASKQYIDPLAPSDVLAHNDGVFLHNGSDDPNLEPARLGPAAM